MFRCRACIGVLLTSLTLESELRIKSHLQKLLTVAKNLFSHLGDVTVLLRQIMAEARHLSQVTDTCTAQLIMWVDTEYRRIYVYSAQIC